MTFPVLPGVRPPSIRDSANGQIPADLLVNVRTYEDYDVYLAVEAATLWGQLRVACFEATGCRLAISGGGAYRTLGQQVTLFLQRYEYPAQGGLPADRYRTYLGRRYSLRKGMAAAATPGTSNHGLGAAVDTEVINPTTRAVTATIASPAWTWLLQNAVRLGWSWELQSESWHLRMIRLPSAPSDEEDEVTLFRVNTNPDAIYLLGADGVRHIGGYEGALRAAANPGWAAAVETWVETAQGDFGQGKVPADVHAWLQQLPTS